jgi:molybdopterin converting factor small subunit
MIQIDLKFAGYFRKFLKEEKEYVKVSLENPSTVRDILMNFDIDFQKIKVKPIIIVNGDVYSLDYVIKDRDEVILINMMSGG